MASLRTPRLGTGDFSIPPAPTSHAPVAVTTKSLPATGLSLPHPSRIARAIAWITRTQVIGDAASAVGVFVLISQLRFPDIGWQTWWTQFGLPAAGVLLVWVALWSASMWYTGAYRAQLRLSARGDNEQVLQAGLLLSGIVFSMFFIVGDYAVSRLLLIALCVAQPLATIGVRAISRRAFAWTRQADGAVRQVLIIGANDDAQAWADSLERHRQLRLHVMGHLLDDEESLAALTRPTLGLVEDLDFVLRSRVVDEIAICLSPDRWSRGVAVAALARDAGKIVRIPMLHSTMAVAGGRTDEIDGIEVVSLVYGPNHLVGLAIKRLFDIGASLVGLVMLSPILLGISLFVLIRDGRPILFIQQRVGINGRVFNMVKFRTMVPDAEARLGEVASMSKISGPAIQIDDDPRITPIGKWMRRLSLDELPQLWNCLRGDMSIIGPRPAPLVEVEKYDLWHRRRLSMRPGITGLAQIEDRKYDDFDDRARLDLRYIDEWSLSLDARLLLQTVPMVLSGSGR